MSLLETLRALLRRWYITFPGLVLACAVALGAWYAVQPSYERSATQLLLPGKQNMPANSNPLLYLGGLSYAADVLVRAVGAENVLNDVLKTHPGTVVDVERDGSSSAPFIVITVTARSNADARDVLAELVHRTATQLANLQKSQHIPADGRITVHSITIDTASTLQQRNRLVATAGAGVAVAALALLLAALTDGLVSQRSRRKSSAAVYSAAAAEKADADATGDASEPVGADAADPRAGRSSWAMQTLPTAADSPTQVQVEGLSDDEGEDRYGGSADAPETAGSSRFRG